jgi:hypothetical protein
MDDLVFEEDDTLLHAVSTPETDSSSSSSRSSRSSSSNRSGRVNTAIEIMRAAYNPEERAKNRERDLEICSPMDLLADAPQSPLDLHLSLSPDVHVSQIQEEEKKSPDIRSQIEEEEQKSPDIRFNQPEDIDEQELYALLNQYELDRVRDMGAQPIHWSPPHTRKRKQGQLAHVRLPQEEEKKVQMFVNQSNQNGPERRRPRVNPSATRAPDPPPIIDSSQRSDDARSYNSSSSGDRTIHYPDEDEATKALAAQLEQDLEDILSASPMPNQSQAASTVAYSQPIGSQRSVSSADDLRGSPPRVNYRGSREILRDALMERPRPDVEDLTGDDDQQPARVVRPRRIIEDLTGDDDQQPARVVRPRRIIEDLTGDDNQQPAAASRRIGPNPGVHVQSNGSRRVLPAFLQQFIPNVRPSVQPSPILPEWIRDVWEI